MYQSHGWWFPDGDIHFVQHFAKLAKKGKPPVYQAYQRSKSTMFVRERKVALDIGANIGLWSRDLCQRFETVIAFEPVQEFVDCLKLNVPADNLQIRKLALGDKDTMINMVITEHNTGHSHVDPQSVGYGNTPMVRLDSLEFERIDYVKIDVEGYETALVAGAEETFKTHKPIIMLEQKPHKEFDKAGERQWETVELLKEWGAREILRIKNESVLGWR